jgi:hypothetical protein
VLVAGHQATPACFSTTEGFSHRQLIFVIEEADRNAVVSLIARLSDYGVDELEAWTVVFRVLEPSGNCLAERLAPREQALS